MLLAVIGLAALATVVILGYKYLKPKVVSVESTVEASIQTVETKAKEVVTEVESKLNL